jgi:hypothetical protein
MADLRPLEQILVKTTKRRFTKSLGAEIENSQDDRRELSYCRSAKPWPLATRT